MAFVELCIGQWFAIGYLLLFPAVLAVLAFIHSRRIIDYDIETGGYIQMTAGTEAVAVSEYWIGPGDFDASALDEVVSSTNHNMRFHEYSVGAEKVQYVESFQKSTQMVFEPAPAFHCLVKAVSWAELLINSSMFGYILVTQCMFRLEDTPRLSWRFVLLFASHQLLGLVALLVDYRSMLRAIMTFIDYYSSDLDMRLIVLLSLLMVLIGLVIGLVNGVVAGTKGRQGHPQKMVLSMRILAILLSLVLTGWGIFMLNGYSITHRSVASGLIFLAPFVASIPVTSSYLKFISVAFLTIGIIGFGTNGSLVCH
ncbi:hypothetical protein DM01DRAFT_1334709 [Hesseltinella vesiculosa]|uniref:Uncharacterized protein n=1 Tax=Hesseltinella vesiculosa TaxID=101127 RepID=A0A1X2GM24_9FUNG|nr:hypothetical protein DM01DRAFT_1334709 [Hesseltinella vesiculosa]